MLLWTFVYKFLYRTYVSIPLVTCLIKSRVAGSYDNSFWGTTKLFFKVTTQFYIPTNDVWVFQFLPIYASAYYVFFDDSHGWYVKVVSHCILTYISLMVKAVQNFLFAYWLFVYLLWRNVCSDPLVIWTIGFLPFFLLSCKSSLYVLVYALPKGAQVLYIF